MDIIPYMIPCISVGWQVITYILKLDMGFKTLHEMDTIVNVSSANYGRVGFGLLVATRMAQLMFLGFLGNPSLGLASMNGLLVFFGLLMVVVLSLHCERDNALGDKGKLRLVSRLHFVSISWILLCYTSHPNHLLLCL